MSTPGNSTVGNISASTNAIVVGDGRLHGIFVASSTSLTLKVYDSLTQAGTVLINTTAVITAPTWLSFPAGFVNGISITIGGSGNFSVVYTRAT